MTAEEYARQLIAEGYMQTSRKFRHLARLPPGLTGKQALSLKDREMARRLDDEEAAGFYLRVHAPALVVDEETFQAFIRLGGRTAR